MSVVFLIPSRRVCTHPCVHVLRLPVCPLESKGDFLLFYSSVVFILTNTPVTHGLRIDPTGAVDCLQWDAEMDRKRYQTKREALRLQLDATNDRNMMIAVSDVGLDGTVDIVVSWCLCNRMHIETPPLDLSSHRLVWQSIAFLVPCPPASRGQSHIC